MASALVGAGLTGSYIFSQTIFSLRAGVQTRASGWILSGAGACATDWECTKRSTLLLGALFASLYTSWCQNCMPAE